MNTVFSETFLEGLIVAALALTAVTVVALLALIWRDFLKRRLW